MPEHIVAVFEDEAPAAAAARELESAGIPSSAIRHYRSESAAEPAFAQPNHPQSAPERAGGGFWSWLLGEEGPQARPASGYDNHSDAYDRRLQAGGTVLAVTVADDSFIHRVIDIIETHEPVQIDEGTEERTETPASRVASPTGLGAENGVAYVGTEASTADTLATRNLDPDLTRGIPVAGESHVSDASAGTTGSANQPREETIPLAEEQLTVGKRTVDRGTTRVRRYVVETPVEREVTLQGERVTIERRRPIASGVGTGAFEERVVEVRETEEEPIVQKTAQVAEEVVVRREGTERTETVRDTVRREEVEIQGDKKVSMQERHPMPGDPA